MKLAVLSVEAWENLCRTNGTTDSHMQARRYAVDHSISAAMPPPLEEEEGGVYPCRKKTFQLHWTTVTQSRRPPLPHAVCETKKGHTNP